MTLQVKVGDSFDGDITIINVNVDRDQSRTASRWKLILFTAASSVSATAFTLTLAYCISTGDYTFMKLIGAATTEVAVSVSKAKAK